MTHRGKFKSRALDSIILEGDVVPAAKAGTSAHINVLIYDKNRHALFATGTDVPADNTAGYAKGCLFIDTDVAAATSGLYVNIGTTALADFDAITDA